MSLNPYLEDRLRPLAEGGLVLDVGCGRGYWLRRMAAVDVLGVGLEPEAPRASEAAAHGPVVVGDATRLPFAEHAFSLVWCVHVLHHLGDPALALAEMRRVLRPDGRLVLAETVEDHPIVRMGRRVRPEWDGVPVRSRFRADALLDVLSGAGFEVTDQRQHSLLSFAAWGLPSGGRHLWLALTRLESILPTYLQRWGAHFECIARPAEPDINHQRD